MSNVAFILARGGSKRIPGKNVKILGNKPLIAWSIVFARQHPEIDRIVVSTDDPRIAEVAENFGVKVPWLRPIELASDTASSFETLTHAILKEKEQGYYHRNFVLLQPTSPFRNQATLSEALLKVNEGNGRPIVSVTRAKTHPFWTFKETRDGQLINYIKRTKVEVRSQDLPPAYEVNGSLYAAGVDWFLENKELIGTQTRAIFSTDRKFDCDIDDEIDWLLAEAIANKYFNIL